MNACDPANTLLTIDCFPRRPGSGCYTNTRNGWWPWRSLLRCRVWSTAHFRSET